jgi:tetratricopeptide (TPR) repeat protein
VEDAIARSLFFLPSVLFVVGGRNRLDWGSQRRAASLEYAGETEWPGLGEAGRDRIRVGALDAADCHAYLQQCLLDEQGDPAMPEQVRAAVSEFSDGMPLYLDVAANHYRSLLARGHAPGVDDFARGVPDLVLRLMEDLDDNACDLLRAAALLGVFDHETLHVALPDMRAAHIEHFLDRSLVFARDEGLYSIHEVLQTSVRLQDSATGNQWSRAEWGAVQHRLVTYWSRQLQDDEAAIWRDRRAQALAFWQLVNLYATTDVEADVLADVVMQVQLRGVWATIDTARDQPEPLLNERGRALLHMLDGMMERQVGSLDEAERLLTAAVDSQSLTPNVRRLAMYYLGETRDVHVGDSLSLFREISQQPDRLGIEAQLALAHALARQGDLVGSLEIANAVEFDENDPEFAYRYFELLGVIWWSAGRLETSAEYFERSRQVAQTTGSPLLMGLALRHLGLAMCWSGSSALTVIEQAESLNRDLGMKPGIGQCLMTRATATTGTAPPGAVDELVDEAVATFRGAGYLDDALGPLAVSVFAACVGADRNLALRRREHLYQQAEGRRPRHWLAITDVWTGEPDAFNRVAWPQGAEQAWRDWEQVLNRRRSSAVG